MQSCSYSAPPCWSSSPASSRGTTSSNPAFDPPAAGGLPSQRSSGGLPSQRSSGSPAESPEVFPLNAAPAAPLYNSFSRDSSGGPPYNSGQSGGGSRRGKGYSPRNFGGGKGRGGYNNYGGGGGGSGFSPSYYRGHHHHQASPTSSHKGSNRDFFHQQVARDHQQGFHHHGVPSRGGPPDLRQPEPWEQHQHHSFHREHPHHSFRADHYSPRDLHHQHSRDQHQQHRSSDVGDSRTTQQERLARRSTSSHHYHHRTRVTHLEIADTARQLAAVEEQIADELRRSRTAAGHCPQRGLGGGRERTQATVHNVDSETLWQILNKLNNRRDKLEQKKKNLEDIVGVFGPTSSLPSVRNFDPSSLGQENGERHYPLTAASSDPVFSVYPAPGLPFDTSSTAPSPQSSAGPSPQASSPLVETLLGEKRGPRIPVSSPDRSFTNKRALVSPYTGDKREGSSHRSSDTGASSALQELYQKSFSGESALSATAPERKFEEDRLSSGPAEVSRFEEKANFEEPPQEGYLRNGCGIIIGRGLAPGGGGHSASGAPSPEQQTSTSAVTSSSSSIFGNLLKGVNNFFSNGGEQQSALPRAGSQSPVLEPDSSVVLENTGTTSKTESAPTQDLRASSGTTSRTHSARGLPEQRLEEPTAPHITRQPKQPPRPLTAEEGRETGLQLLRKLQAGFDCTGDDSPVFCAPLGSISRQLFPDAAETSPSAPPPNPNHHTSFHEELQPPAPLLPGESHRKSSDSCSFDEQTIQLTNTNIARDARGADHPADQKVDRANSSSSSSNMASLDKDIHPVFTNILNVYADNLEAAFHKLTAYDIAENSGVIGVEAYFPGLVLRPTIPVESFLEHHYATLRNNVDCTNLIQLDITFKRGEDCPEGAEGAGKYMTFR